jgi:hypothetical protein
MQSLPIRSSQPSKAPRQTYWNDDFLTAFRELQRRNMPQLAKALERGCLRAATVQEARNLIERYKEEYLTPVQSGATLGRR